MHIMMCIKKTSSKQLNFHDQAMHNVIQNYKKCVLACDKIVNTYHHRFMQLEHWKWVSLNQHIRFCAVILRIWVKCPFKILSLAKILEQKSSAFISTLLPKPLLYFEQKQQHYPISVKIAQSRTEPHSLENLRNMPCTFSQRNNYGLDRNAEEGERDFAQLFIGVIALGAPLEL